MNEPILIHCEGSGVRGHEVICPSSHAMCVMCGRIKPMDEHGKVVEHDRDDILARINRGDFG